MTHVHGPDGQGAAEQAEGAYSETAIDHMRHPRNVGPINEPDGQGCITGSCGDTLEIWLRVSDGVIRQASFWTDGCGAMIAAGSTVTELARGKRPGEAFRIEQPDVLEALGGLPDDSAHCALLASNALKQAVQDYLAFRNEPWKRAYRKR